MPELPEAETIARGLRPLVKGKSIRTSRVIRPDVLRVPARTFQGSVRGRYIVDVERRGKKVVLPLSGGRILVVGLGMTGRLIHLAPRSRPPRDAKHHAVRFAFESGGALLFDDTRRFGTIECLTTDDWRVRSASLGPEPLADGFTGADLRGRLASSRSPIRSWLLDQRRIAGVGNIYALEALHRARVHPRRPARSLSADEAARLLGELRTVLREAITARGTTVRDYRTATGAPGTFVGSLVVYGREGEPCARCRTPIERFVLSNRSAFHCPTCQPEPP